jgi:hypothetical protein
MAGFPGVTSVAADECHQRNRIIIQIVAGLNQNVGIYQRWECRAKNSLEENFRQEGWADKV